MNKPQKLSVFKVDLILVCSFYILSSALYFFIIKFIDMNVNEIDNNGFYLFQRIVIIPLSIIIVFSSWGVYMLLEKIFKKTKRKNTYRIILCLLVWCISIFPQNFVRTNIYKYYLLDSIANIPIVLIVFAIIYLVIYSVVRSSFGGILGGTFGGVWGGFLGGALSGFLRRIYIVGAVLIKNSAKNRRGDRIFFVDIKESLLNFLDNIYYEFLFVVIIVGSIILLLRQFIVGSQYAWGTNLPQKFRILGVFVGSLVYTSISLLGYYQSGYWVYF